MGKLEKIIKVLKDKKYRITSSRISVITILSKNRRFLSAEEIFHKIEKSKNLRCDQVSVYRVLTMLEKVGIVVASQFQGEAMRYKLSLSWEENHSSEHHHFIKCNRCHQIERFEGCFISQKEKELREMGYRELSHHLEIRGICPKCSDS